MAQSGHLDYVEGCPLSGAKADITLTCLECRLLTHYGPRQSDFAVTHKIAAH